MESFQEIQGLGPHHHLPSQHLSYTPSTASVQPGMTGWSGIKQMDVDLSLLQCL